MRFIIKNSDKTASVSTIEETFRVPQISIHYEPVGDGLFRKVTSTGPEETTEWKRWLQAGTDHEYKVDTSGICRFSRKMSIVVNYIEFNELEALIRDYEDLYISLSGWTDKHGNEYWNIDR